MHEFLPASAPAETADIRAQIVRLEARIEEMGDAVERCRRIGQIAKLAVGLGGAWAAAAVVGLLPLNPMALVGSITLLIGGVVALGSNASTWDQLSAALRAAHAERAALIGQIQLHVVGGTAIDRA